MKNYKAKMKIRLGIYCVIAVLGLGTVSVLPAQTSAPELEVYFIGNSLTRNVPLERLKALFQGQEGDLDYGIQLGGGHRLEQHLSMRNHDNKPGEGEYNLKDPYGEWDVAFSKHTFDAIVLQPYLEKLSSPVEFYEKWPYFTAGTLQAADGLIEYALGGKAPGQDRLGHVRPNPNHTASKRFYIYATWPRMEHVLGREGEKTYSAYFNAPYRGEVQTCADYYAQLVQGLNRGRPDLEILVRMIPAGHVLAALDEKIRSGRLPGIEAFYERNKEYYDKWRRDKSDDSLVDPVGFQAEMGILNFYADAVHMNQWPFNGEDSGSFGAYVAAVTIFSTLSNRNPTLLTTGPYEMFDPEKDAELIGEVKKTVWEVVGTTAYTGIGVGANHPPATGPLVLHPENSRYFTDDSRRADGSLRTVFLTGSHTWNNLVDMGKSDPPEPFDYNQYLVFMDRLGHNFIRLWTWESTTWDTRSNGRWGKDFVHHVAPMAWKRTGPSKALDGKPKFDLTKFNDEYFQRLRQRALAARERGIYVSVMLFEGWGLSHGDKNGRGAPKGWAFRSHPFHRSNNINGVNGDKDGDGLGLEIHSLAVEKVNQAQRRYIHKVIDTVNDLDNVLYEVINEGGEKEWNRWVIDVVKKYEASKPKQHVIGLTAHGGELTDSMIDSPAEWISPGGRGGYKDPAPPWNETKAGLIDTDHIWGIGGTHGWVWRSFLRGYQPIFMDPYDGSVLAERFDPKFDPLRISMGYARQYARRVNLAAMRPWPKLSSTEFCLANPGEEYLVYFPKTGEGDVNLEAVSGKMNAEWFHPLSGQMETGAPVDGGAEVKFKTPGEGDWLLYLSLLSEDGE